MAGYQISICTYSFSVVWETKDKKLQREQYNVFKSSLIGQDEAEIKADPTGRNKIMMIKNFKRAGGSKAALDIAKFRFVYINIISQYGQTKWIDKPET